MGVKGINPFLERFCPDVVKKLPSRFKTLAGNRVVFDGTLITQRFHFGRKVHPYRHVSGWYKVAHELRESGVSAICVFDGKERSTAKAREIERRASLRLMAGSRGSLEKERFHRLHQLQSAVELFQGLSPKGRQGVVAALRERPLPVDETPEIPTDRLTDVADSEVASSDFAPEVPPPILDESQGLSHYLLLTPDKLAEYFRILYINYKASIAKFLWVDPLASLVLGETGALNEDKEDVQNAVTKSQHDLALDEGFLWSKIVEGLTPPGEKLQEAVEDSLANLVRRSYLMFISFDKRVNRAKTSTYRESIEILEAMGIPCISATGAVEAESLASALVVNGHADFVASEDTDVLVYGAPLMKNVTSPSEPLVIVSGGDISSSLGLSRAAYIDLALLMGTDFTDRIRNIGPKTAYEFIKRYGNIEGVVAAVRKETRYSSWSWEDYLARVNAARLLFTTAPPLPPVESFKGRGIDHRAVEAILTRSDLRSLLHKGNHWDYEAAYEDAMGKDYFGDRPAAS